MIYDPRPLQKIIIRATPEGSFAWIGTLDFWLRIPPGLMGEDQVRHHFETLAKSQLSGSSRLRHAFTDAKHFPVTFEKGNVPSFFTPPSCH